MSNMFEQKLEDLDDLTLDFKTSVRGKLYFGKDILTEIVDEVTDVDGQPVKTVQQLVDTLTDIAKRNPNSFVLEWITDQALDPITSDALIAPAAE